MKEKLYKYIPLLIGFIISFSACDADDDSIDPLTPKPKPIINITIDGVENQDSYIINQGEGVIFEINAISNGGNGAKLDKIQMNQKGNNEITISGDITFTSENGTQFDFSNNDRKSIKDSENENLKITKQFANGSSISDYPGTTIYTITITDDAGLISTKEVNIVVYTPLKPAKQGQIYHIESNKEGNYSFQNDTAFSGDANLNPNLLAEISNTDGDGSVFTGSFKIGDFISSYTKLVSVPVGGFDYDNAYFQEAQAVYDAETKKTSISNPSVGDIYIFNIEVVNVFTVVKITSIEPNNNDCNCTNKGKMEFEYKKTS